jgi:S-adenosylmethionine synthetase
MRASYLFTSESVSEGHPDKVADQISDSIVDLFLSKDSEARIACETLTTTQTVVLAGEIRCKGIYENGEWAPGALEEIEQTVRGVVKRIGYEQDGFHWQTFKFANNLHGQSAHIAQGVDASGNKDEGAGDQGIMFGFACDETPDLMPATLHYSHRILHRMAQDRHSGAAPFLEPDAKSQVTLRYENGKPAAATAIVVSTQHKKGYDEGANEAELHAYVKKVVADLLPADLLSDDTVYHINPTGSFEIGGPDGDAGLTGRKIIVDTYGGASPHGGGAFSGKDPTKVDRSAAYITRYLAKNIVAAGLATRCTIQLAYAIGIAKPLSLYVDTHGTGTVSDSDIEEAIGRIDKLGSMTPRGIRMHLGLNKPIYERTAAYGHFGRDPDGDFFPWERTDLVDDLKAALSETVAA